MQALEEDMLEMSIWTKKEAQKISRASLSILDPERAMTITKNLCSLLSHAESFIPGFLKEDDDHVLLLRLLLSQIESLLAPGASEDNRINFIVLITLSSAESKFERSVSWDKKFNIGDQEVQNTGVCPSPLLTKIAPDHDNQNINLKEGILENDVSQEVSQLEVKNNGNDESIDVERKSGRSEQGKPNGGAVEIERLREGDRISKQVDQIRVPHKEDEKVDYMHSDEKQQRKRKRTVMNDK
ncbi:Hypothetical predicted protein [Olea europaea subsp. europaea]|uniref:Uncharacterized protein n=1 Tax=Olea europaea subsp. europaea TaxID=158383 RepID=A0A8S0T9Y4_OLEEU|nr:Hypothetical predicted protein [Olea europaea subsp. europaea]